MGKDSGKAELSSVHRSERTFNAVGRDSGKAELRSVHGGV